MTVEWPSSTLHFRITFYPTVRRSVYHIPLSFRTSSHRKRLKSLHYRALTILPKCLTNPIWKDVALLFKPPKRSQLSKLQACCVRILQFSISEYRESCLVAIAVERFPIRHRSQNCKIMQNCCWWFAICRKSLKASTWWLGKNSFMLTYSRRHRITSLINAMCSVHKWGIYWEVMENFGRTVKKWKCALF